MFFTPYDIFIVVKSEIFNALDLSLLFIIYIFLLNDTTFSPA